MRLIRLRLVKDLQQDVSEHFKRFAVSCVAKKLPSLDLSKCFLFLALLAQVMRTVTSQTLRSHDISLSSQQLQNSHIVVAHTGPVKKTSGRKTDLDYGESAEPWYDGSDWHDTEELRIRTPVRGNRLE